MSKQGMKVLQRTSLLDGDNSAYLESLYESWLQDNDSVPENWRDYFAGLPQVNGQARDDILHSELRREFSRLTGRLRGHRIARLTGVRLAHESKQVRVLQLINAYRFCGHQYARTDPLRRSEPELAPEMDLGYHDLSEADFDTVFQTGSLVGPEEATLEEILYSLNRTYCETVGAEYMHISSTEEKRWIQHHLESVHSHPHMTNEKQHWLLKRLTSAEGIERYLHSKYVGQKRFSLEGGESLIPLMSELIDRSGARGVKEIVMGMSHRGRLNVLINILGKLPSELFSEFEDLHDRQHLSGDVKYHQGFSSKIRTPGGLVHLAMAFNPSHLEIVSPVVHGSVRARQQRYGEHETSKILPIVIHGDSAFAGQGVVMETFNMSGLRGYSTHGTVHVVVNNQIGFTTSHVKDSRSTLYCTDVAKMVGAPIFHVNGDDPEAVIFITQVALDYRMQFKKDVVIDLVCYRRHGHNEADEPAATQPMMYRDVRTLPTARTLYAQRLEEENIISPDTAEQMQQNYRDLLDAGSSVTPKVLLGEPVAPGVAVNW
ncbi:MAG: thiamine pyrophosphate-dependent enzyme, partial [Gammaproteobacteria bacterium]|nr:thiamine pyrophosphate-dependent enzyme [Gammaproteobacteria bacterium]